MTNTYSTRHLPSNKQIGLIRKETCHKNEFIVYWLPRIQEKPCNLIAFQGDAYTEAARPTVTPAPDTTLRIFMAFHPLQESIDIPPQTPEYTERVGFTVVEWGGTELS